jgi:hypothetical protein
MHINNVKVIKRTWKAIQAAREYEDKRLQGIKQAINLEQMCSCWEGRSPTALHNPVVYPSKFRAFPSSTPMTQE